MLLEESTASSPSKTMGRSCRASTDGVEWCQMKSRRGAPRQVGIHDEWIILWVTIYQMETVKQLKQCPFQLFKPPKSLDQTKG